MKNPFITWKHHKSAKLPWHHNIRSNSFGFWGARSDIGDGDVAADHANIEVARCFFFRYLLDPLSQPGNSAHIFLPWNYNFRPLLPSGTDHQLHCTNWHKKATQQGRIQFWGCVLLWTSIKDLFPRPMKGLQQMWQLLGLASKQFEPNLFVPWPKHKVPTSRRRARHLEKIIFRWKFSLLA